MTKVINADLLSLLRRLSDQAGLPDKDDILDDTAFETEITWRDVRAAKEFLGDKEALLPRF